MQTVNIHEAKTHLSRLVSQVANGESFIIAKAGKPVARVVPIEPEVKPKREFGFLAGKYKSPVDFKAFAREEIEEMFFGNPEKLITKKRKK